MYLQCFPLGELATNCYLIADETTQQAAIIDPGGEVDEIIAAIEKHHFKPVLLLLTHGHFDHIWGNARLKERYQLPICIHEADAAKLTSPEENLSAYLGLDCTSPAADKLLKHNDILKLGELTIKVFFMPGHSQGGVAYYIESAGVVFCGDSLFYESIGRTDFADGSYPKLIASIKNYLFTLPDNTAAYPGHGPKTSIAHEKKKNQYLKE